MRRGAKRASFFPSEFHLETLEKRILFSADAAFTALDAFPAVTSELVVLKPLGASFLNQDSIDSDYATLFRQIGSSLSDNADLLISATLSASPLWRLLDPIPILVQSDDDEGGADNADALIDSKNRSAAANDPGNPDIKYG